MKILLIFQIFLISVCAFGQRNPTKKAEPIVAEGKLLYKSEMASWLATDLFITQYKDTDKIGGYFSYTENEVSKCIFFSRANSPKVVGTISFDKSFDSKSAKIDVEERDFSKLEGDLYQLREAALEEIRTDTLFKSYQNTRFNLIPLVSKKEKKVYILTGPTVEGVVIFGNDYLLTFNRLNKLKSKKQLHKNIIPVSYDVVDENGKKSQESIHSHTDETGDFITATDICTLMLYEKFTNWKAHHVVSQKYLNIWNCEEDRLVVLPMEAIRNMSEGKER